MRHGIAGKKFGRKSTWRKATVRDIAIATLKQERIQTTKVRAKEARKLVDQLITLGKKGTLAHKRRAFALINDHKLVSILFNETAPRFTNRTGGYTRVIPLAHQRRGDNAEMALLELTEKTPVETKEAAEEKGKAKKSKTEKVEDAQVVEEKPKKKAARKTAKKKTAKKAESK